MNKNELLSIMVKHGDKNGDVAEYLGITQQSFSNKINEKNSIGFTQVEIMLLKNRYNLSAKQIDNIFFTNRAQKKEIWKMKRRLNPIIFVSVKAISFGIICFLLILYMFIGAVLETSYRLEPVTEYEVMQD